MNEKLILIYSVFIAVLGRLLTVLTSVIILKSDTVQKIITHICHTDNKKIQKIKILLAFSIQKIKNKLVLIGLKF